VKKLHVKQGSGLMWPCGLTWPACMAFFVLTQTHALTMWMHVSCHEPQFEGSKRGVTDCIQCTESLMGEALVAFSFQPFATCGLDF
jgi:hypothetical protein